MGAAGRRPKPSISRGGTAQSSASTWSIGNVMTSRAVRQCASKDWSASHPHDCYAGAAARACRLWTDDKAPRGEVAPFRSMDILAVAPALQQQSGSQVIPPHPRRSRRHDADIALERYPGGIGGRSYLPGSRILKASHCRRGALTNIERSAKDSGRGRPQYTPHASTPVASTTPAFTIPLLPPALRAGGKWPSGSARWNIRGLQHLYTPRGRHAATDSIGKAAASAVNSALNAVKGPTPRQAAQANMLLK